MMPEEDDIIEELHRIREAVWKEAGGTPEAYARYYQKKGEERLAAEAAARAAGTCVERPRPKLRKAADIAAAAKSIKNGKRRRKAAAR